MNRRWVPLGVWLVLLVSFTAVSGVSIPPSHGVGDADSSGPLGAAQLTQLLATATSGLDTYSLSPGLAAHGPTELLVVTAPERGPFDGEQRVLDTFLRDGGTLVLFTTTPTWNAFTSGYGITVHGDLLIPTTNATSERLIPVSLPSNLGGGELLLPNATTVTDPGPNVQTVVPDRDLVLDVDGNGTIEVPPDQAGSFPVLATTNVGQGRLVVVTSTEAVLGSGFDRNQAAVERLVTQNAGAQPAAFDEGTHPRGASDLVRGPAQALLALGHWSWTGAAVTLLAAAGLVLVLPARPRHASTASRLDDLTDATREVMQRGGD